MIGKSQPPKWATWLLHAYCAPHLLEEIAGDLLEEYEHQVIHNGIRKARLDYIRSVFGFIKPFAIKRKTSTSTSVLSMNMLNHFLKVAFRNLIRHRSFSFINVMGLALGMTCCIFIFLWTQDEKSIDNFHPNGDRLFNVYQTVASNGKADGSYSTPLYYDGKKNYIPIADMKQVIPEVKGVSFYATGYDLPWGHAETFQLGDKLQKLEGSRASEDFLKIFHFPVLAGDAKTALKDLSSVAISRKMASLFFDSPENAIGKSLRYENRFDLNVTAVFEDVPAQSSLRFDFLINWESQMTRLDWASGNVLTTVLIADEANPDDIAVKINRMFDTVKDKNSPFDVTLGLQPFRDLYLVSNFVNGKPNGGRIEYVKIFSGVAIFILVIACINFMNLSTARSVKRAKEVGVRKVVGSSRSSLVSQFFGESIVLSFLGLVLALVLVSLFLSSFNTLTDKHITSPVLQPSTWPVLIGLMLITGVVAGSYPALFLSSLKPAGILKGVLRFTQSALWFRKGLAGFQFVISIVLLIVTIVMSKQMDYVQHTSTGYDRENLIYSSLEGELAKPEKYKLFKQQLTGMPGIAMIDRSTEAPHAMNFVIDAVAEGQPVTGDFKNNAIQWEGKERGVHAGFKPSSVGFDFLKMMNLKLVEGRDFSRDMPTDSADAFIVNETAVKEMGMKDPIGKWVSAWKKKGHIIGVLKDYHTHSFHEPIKPLIIDVKEYEYFGVVMVRTEPRKTKEALASMEKVYKEINPNFAFAYKFMDEEYEKLYHSEQVITKLSNIFAGLAIVISCLGLLGLVIFSAEQRTKEFGIRKVLGATAANIVTLLSQDFLALVCVSFCVAAPLAGYFMYQWLQNFAFQIELSWWIFAAAGVSALLVALITICFQALQSALANPIKSLRAE